jgi:alkaline phosphatase
MSFLQPLICTVFLISACANCFGQASNDAIRTFQFQAIELEQSDWIHWGNRKSKFSNWTNHSNRLIPVYSFGMSLESVNGENSCYRNAEKITQLYGKLPAETHNPEAEYFDQTDVYRLQELAWKSGKRNVILMVFDGMDWNTTRAASIYKNKEVLYTEGRGTGLAFLDYRKAKTEFGFCVTSPHDGTSKHDVDAQIVKQKNDDKGGGYSWKFGGSTPWNGPDDNSYLMGKRKNVQHPYTDSAASATSMLTGYKTYNAAINVDPNSKQLDSIAHQMQRDGFAVGVVTSVPISHATPACVYSHNVTRNDYQDISRDLLGLRSVAHRYDSLAGVDVLIGCGWGELKDDDRENQGLNFIPGTKYISDLDIERVDHLNGGKYVVAQRTVGKSGKKVLSEGVAEAISSGKRFFGFFGGPRGHLPYKTADGDFRPTRGESKIDVYTSGDISENPTLSDMTGAALELLEKNDKGFYLMVEAGDVDWALHNNNIDDAIGAVFSGEEAFTTITNWVENNSNWDETCLILTSDHGHMMVLDDPRVLTGEREPCSNDEFVRLLEVKRSIDGEKQRLLDEGSEKMRAKMDRRHSGGDAMQK